MIFTVPEGIDAKTVRELAYGVGKRLGTLDKSMLCNPSTGAIRPPGAPHRAGGASVLVGYSVFEALEILAEGTTAERVGLLAQRFPWQKSPPARPLPKPSAIYVRIPDRARARMKSGENGTADGTRSGLIMSLACSYVRAGAPRRQLAMDLLNPVNKAGEKLRELQARSGVRTAQRWLEGTWEKAGEYMAADSRSPRDNLQNEEKALSRIIFSPALKGRPAMTDRVVLAAHASIPLNVGSTVYQASDRQLAERAGVSRRAIPKAHRHLESKGILRRISAGKEKEASLWQILPPQESKEPNLTDTSAPSASPISSLSSPSTYRPMGCVLLGNEEDTSPQEETFRRLLDGLGHDAFRYGGLGAGSLIVWASLEETTPKASKDLRKQLGLSRSAIHRALNLLASHGLAERTADGWLGVDGDLDQIAESLGTAGKGKADRRLHQNEREDYLRSRDQFVHEVDESGNKTVRDLRKRQFEHSAHESRPGGA